MLTEKAKDVTVPAALNIFLQLGHKTNNNWTPHSSSDQIFIANQKQRAKEQNASGGSWTHYFITLSLISARRLLWSTETCTPWVWWRVGGTIQSSRNQSKENRKKNGVGIANQSASGGSQTHFLHCTRLHCVQLIFVILRGMQVVCV